MPAVAIVQLALNILLTRQGPIAHSCSPSAALSRIKQVCFHQVDQNLVSLLDIRRHTAETEACLQGKGMPILLHGLLQHETKLSVLNFSIRKASSHTGSIPNKAELLFCTGLRCAATLPFTAVKDPAAAKLAWNSTFASAMLQSQSFCPAVPCLPETEWAELATALCLQLATAHGFLDARGPFSACRSKVHACWLQDLLCTAYPVVR